MSRGLLHAQLPSRPKQTRVPTLSAPTLSTESMESLAKGKGDETDASLLARVERLGGFLGSTKFSDFLRLTLSDERNNLLSAMLTLPGVVPPNIYLKNYSL